jgi:hypothetical protein
MSCLRFPVAQFGAVAQNANDFAKVSVVVHSESGWTQTRIREKKNDEEKKIMNLF